MEETMTLALTVFSIGLACGIILSVLPLIVGEIINLAFKIMKGE